MNYCVVVLSLKKDKVVFVDAPFVDYEAAVNYAEAQNTAFAARGLGDKYRASAKVITKPE